nr:MAG TPA: hypothetical protein [Caudoviricetes sp.]
MIKKYLKLAYMVKLQKKKKGDDFSSPPPLFRLFTS